MVATGSGHDAEWRSFYREHRRDAIADLAAAYPDERSLYVDIVDLHQHDPAVAKSLLADPDAVLDTATAVLRDLDDDFDRVNVRVENHPGMLSPGGVRSRHVGELVAVQGIAAEIGPVEAALERGVYECRACGSAVRHDPSGGDDHPPPRCDCGVDDAFALDRGRSTFVDVRRVTLAALPGEQPEDRDPPTVDVHLDDDLVDVVDPGQQLLATGVVRLEGEGGRRFEFTVDALGVSEERPGGTEEEPAPGEALQDVIRSRWERTRNGP